MVEKNLSSFDGTKIYYRVEKNKNPHTLVFLHGVGGNWTVWKKELQYFQKRGYSTLVFDLRGHGLSDAPDDLSKYRLYSFSRDLHNILNKEKIDPFTLVGHSLGGGVAINYCMRYKKKLPVSLVLVESSTTFPFKHNRLLNLGTYMTEFLRFVSSHKLTSREHFFHLKDIDLSFTGMKENLKIISHLLHITPIRSVVKALDNLENFVFKNHKRIDLTMKNFPSPILLIAGRLDEVIPPKYVRLVKKLNNNAKYHLFRNAGHKVIMDQADQVSHVIHNFIKESLENAKK
ncbi:hypothetical protein COY27_05920 [Candidatus Woesearchaeota archaeon CG_4_10_14_0_2_um_filter_33_13]|nr:MAG: hypothetical protein COY27_05920 [Candidatus Woesearchaeota archaeon CG_4_10_14_0_2_um_filter_33_13]